MLTFLRKHQKIFFLVITVVTISSFVFFGTYQAFAPRYRAEDPILFETIDGKKISKSTFTRLCHFLSEETPIPTESNFLNDGIISKEILVSHLGEGIYQHFQDKIDSDLSSRFEKEKNFQPYVHPDGRFVSAEKVWSLFCKEFPEQLTQFQKGKACGPENFNAKVDLFLAEKRFPSPLLVYLLRSQQEQYKLKPDPRLYRGDLGLFGYKNIEEWFGPNFMQASTSFILNGAAIARQKGYTVSKQEVMWDIQQRVESAFKALNSKERNVSSPKALLSHFMARLGIGEEDLVDMWEDITLFRRLMNEVGGSALADSYALREFYSFADRGIDLEISEIPEDFRLSSIEDLKRFELYLQLTAGIRKEITSLPDNFDPMDVIEKRAADLVRRPLVLEVTALMKNECESKVSLKEIWAWEVKSENWEKVKETLPSLAQKEAKDEAMRDEILTHLSENDRDLIDKRAAAAIAATHPEWIELMLKEKKMEEKSFLVSTTGRGLTLPGITDAKSLLSLLDKDNEVMSYSQDGIHYFHLVVKERGEKSELLAFAKAVKEGILDEKLKEKSDAAEIDLLVDALFEEGKAMNLVDKKEVERTDKEKMAAQLRFASFLAKEKVHATSSPMPWAPVKKEMTLVRSKPLLFSFDEVAAMEKGSCSEIKLTQNGVSYFHVIGDKVMSGIPSDKLKMAQEMLSGQAKQSFFEKWIVPMTEKKAICFLNTNGG